MALRNEVVHTGRETSDDTVDDALDLIEDVMLLLDYMDGHRWVWAYIHEVVKEGIPPPPNT